jgi:hypothetical protein
MNKSQLKQFTEIVQEREKYYNFNDYVMNYLDETELEAIGDETELIEYLELANQDFNITQAEVIYYATAIDYLKEYDQSLQESLEIAHEMGYTADNLDSEKLASLLKSRNNEEDYQTFLREVESDISELFE